MASRGPAPAGGAPVSKSARGAAFMFTFIQPAQSLALINGGVAHEQAAHLAERVRREAGEQPGDQVRRSLELALARPADAAEVQRGLDLIEKLQTQHGCDAQQALRLWCLTVLNQNEFVFVD